MNKIFFICAMLCFGFFAHAGGPFLIDDQGGGEPARWPYDAAQKKWIIHWKADKGGLNAAVTHQRAIDVWVKPLFEKWKGAALPVKGQEVPVNTVALDFVYEGATDSDITVENYRPFVTPDINELTPTVIIFDADGSIIQDYFGNVDIECGAPKNCVAGLAAPLRRDASTKVILSGFVILNGRLVDQINTAQNKEMNSNQFKGVILHEMGHLLNLDHTQVNAEMSEGCKSFSCAEGGAIATMYPASLSQEQFLFHRDDVVSLSWLYPAQSFSDNFCTVVGEIQNGEGKGMQGVNVIAKGVGDPVTDVRSWVSGVLYPAGTENGTYILTGLTPGEEYEVSFEALTHKYDGGGGFGPLGADSPTDIARGSINGAGGKASVLCEKGGEVISMPAFQMSGVDAGTGASQAGGVEEEGKKKKGWFCQLNRQSEEIDLFFTGFWILFGFVLFLIRRHCYKCRS